MGYLPSFVQKRVLRYVLSRFNIVDASALDLEQLDITWGKKSTFEFRDVGLQLEVRCSLGPKYATIPGLHDDPLTVRNSDYQASCNYQTTSPSHVLRSVRFGSQAPRTYMPAE